LGTDVFFRPAKIFNELDRFQRDPGWLAVFPDSADETTVPRAEIYASIVREHKEPGGDGRPLWSLHADQWVAEDEHHAAEPAVAPTDILSLCIQADPRSSGMGIESEPSVDDGVLVFYTWAELRLTPEQARELLRLIGRKFQDAFPDREEP
jgi:hypothetical protein